MLIDTHCHVNFAAYDKDREEVIQRALDNDVFMINVGSNYLSSRHVVEIAKRDGCYAAIGLHPINIKQGKKRWEERYNEDILEDSFDYKKYRSLINDKVVAIGEIGLDYWYKPKGKAKREEYIKRQKQIFEKQKALAKELKLPIIFHCRMAYHELDVKNTKGVMHCFIGDWKRAKRYLDKGLYLGFNGMIYKRKLDEVIKKCPLDRILVETDSPFLIPPMIKQSKKFERNEPSNVKHIVQTIAEIRGEKYDKIAEHTFNNAKVLFGI